MGIIRILILAILVYTIFKVFTRLLAPLFEGYHEKDRKASGRSEASRTRVKNIIIDTSKSKHKIDGAPNMNKLDAEDVDFEELK